MISWIGWIGNAAFGVMIFCWLIEAIADGKSGFAATFAVMTFIYVCIVGVYYMKVWGWI